MSAGRCWWVVVACLIVLICDVGAFGQVTIAGRPYQKLDSRIATRDAFVRQFTGVSADWGSWSVLVPFDHPQGATNIDKKFPPEDELTKMKPGGQGPDLKAEFTGKGGKKISWRTVEVQNEIGGNGGAGPINLAAGLKEDESIKAMGYLYRSIAADRDIDVPVEMGSDDGMRLWLNGELLVDENQEQPLDPHAFRRVLKLKKGVNHLLVKVSQGGGGWQFQMSRELDMDPVAEAALEYQLDQDFPDDESRCYRLVTIAAPKSVSLEVGGIDLLPSGDPILCTRRGDVFVVRGAYDTPALAAKFELFASGLQEPLGLAVRPGPGSGADVYLVQRSELTLLRDTDGDGRADLFKTVCDAWKISGNYHEYAFGPKFDKDGYARVNLNLAHSGGETVMGATIPTRGCTVKIDVNTGEMTKVADGLRSPDGIGTNAAGDVFYTDNQGDYVATNKLCQVKDGAFYGHQASLKFRDGWSNWKKDGKPVPEITMPAVWFPYKKMGQSASDVVLDDTGGSFGPFAGQLFVGDQTTAEVFRVFLERVTDESGRTEYQGACFPFRKGFESGVHRMVMAHPQGPGSFGSMFVGMTDRGWGSTGPKREGLQRVVWTGAVPFEILEMKIESEGFDLVFTHDLDESAASPGLYRMSSYTYEYHPDYGSPEIDAAEVRITGAEKTGPRSVRLHVDKLRTGTMGYVHELSLSGVKDAAGESLLHRVAYYTVQRIPRQRSPGEN
jgi:glucose/arabinose dehydrogenase